MRILIAIGVPRQKEAGAAGVVLNHARELENLGHSVECWFLDDIVKKHGKSKRFEALRFARAVAKRIRKESAKFDVANIHAPWGCVYGLRKKWGGGGKLPAYVLTMQGSEERYVQVMKREDRQGRATNFGWKNRMWHRLYHQTMYDIAIRTADFGAVANREAWILSELKYGREPGKIWYVPNGAEAHFFSEREYPDKAALRLLYVGTWIDRKGVFYLSEAYRLLAETNTRVQLTIAGCGLSHEEMRVNFSEEAWNSVTVIPFVSREEMPGVYAAHDIFVFPSLVEGMPLTLLEAMASGMPVVTTNTSGMSDVVEDEFNGLLVQPADARKLAEAMGRLCASAALRKSIGLAAQTTARRYTWKEVAKKLEKVFLQANKNEGR